MHLKRLFIAGMLFSVLASFTSIGLVCASSEMWSKTYEGGVGYSLVETSDGGFAVAAVGGNSLWLVKTDANGNMEWNRTYEAVSVHSLVEASNGGYVIAGGKELVKTDSYGNIEWNKFYGGSVYNQFNFLIETSDGGYAMGGSFNQNDEDPFDDCDFWLVKTDAEGNLEWDKTYGGSDYDYANSLVEASDGGYLLAGSTGLWLVQSEAWIVKTDEQGNMEWNQTYGGKERSEVNSVVKTSDGGYALAGYLSGDVWLIKIDESGDVTWDQTYSKGQAYSLVATSDGGYALAGTTSGRNGDQTYTESWMIKTDASGNEVWSQTYEGTADQYISSLVETSDGTFAMAGYISHAYPDSPELLLMKTDEYGYIPEFPSWTIIPSVLIASAALLFFKKRLSKHTSGSYL
ncbi:MAG: hypothetical protein PVH73_06745 [Candidatus Bathyarchaeota archaeon]|jgi:hypothetical protein